jgi:hypothetical protein
LPDAALTGARGQALKFVWKNGPRCGNDGSILSNFAGSEMLIFEVDLSCDSF